MPNGNVILQYPYTQQSVKDQKKVLAHSTLTNYNNMRIMFTLGRLIDIPITPLRRNLSLRV